MKLSFSLKGKAVGPPPPPKPATPFTTLEDDAIDSAHETCKDGPSEVQQVMQKTSLMSRATRKKLEEERKIDQTVFEYDEVYDLMKQAEQKTKEKRDMEARERKPRYIGALLSSAATRRLDYLRAEEKMMQREREEEGDEFTDKEQFVTQAYKDQMAEVRRAEEEERQREEMENKKNKGTSTGLTHFYRQLLDRSEDQHSVAVAATKPSKGLIGPEGPNLTISKPPNFAQKSDVELAQTAIAEGKQVELNDDNQIVDRRNLLSAGLNLAAPNTRQLGGIRTIAPKKTGPDSEVNAHRAVGIAASRKEINERRVRELEKQLEEEQERLGEEKELKRRQLDDRVVTKRNTEDDIQSARDRYLERKRRKLSDGSAITREVALEGSVN